MKRFGKAVRETEGDSTFTLYENGNLELLFAHGPEEFSVYTFTDIKKLSLLLSKLETRMAGITKPKPPDL